MSNDLQEIKFPPDFSPSDIKDVERFMQSGLPNIKSVSDEMLAEMKEMYLNGASFPTISMRFRKEKRIIMYRAFKDTWYSERSAQIAALVESAPKKIENFQIENVHFLLDTSSAIRHYYATKLEDYRRTKNPAILDNLNTKLMTVYAKIVDTLKSLDDKSPKSGSVNMTAEPGSTVNVTMGPAKETEEDLAKVLKVLADMQRVKDNK